MDEDISKLLKAWREKNSLTQLEAAKLLGVTAKTLQAWEQNYRTPKPITVRFLLQIIGKR
jgi:DNA-binding transcriptional regulator YiaG